MALLDYLLKVLMTLILKKETIKNLVNLPIKLSYFIYSLAEKVR